MSSESDMDCQLSEFSQIARLEELWKDKPEAKIEDITKTKGLDQPEIVPLRFEDVHQYQKIFSPLVHLEAENDEKRKESQTQEDITFLTKITMSNTGSTGYW
ncbi:hypothetical protein GJ496_009039 [Pomphorhynchus laevis]|nr:hypothetical protein GJ496_009039 [Pomphorhynchus laevis]